jgi:NAD(P)-dependent dehydrogenase (short-subunit alcohol dehydrogenase family)
VGFHIISPYLCILNCNFIPDSVSFSLVLSLTVNYFGMVSTVKAFLPILKKQACNQDHKDARIVNVVSMAGLVAAGFGSTYHGSKFAAEGFSICLRHEMDAFDIDVVTVNPSFHETPMTDKMPQVCNDIWNNLDPKLREEYGEGKISYVY